MIKLKPYQEDVIKTIKKQFQAYDRQYCEMPTGSGKTITFLSYAQQNHKKILIIVTTKDLMNQVYESALLFYHKSQISRKGDHYNESFKDVHICIINSIRGEYLHKLSLHYVDLIIIDEAHHSHAMQYKRFLNNVYSNLFKTKILGMTATADRADGKMLEEILGQKTVCLSLSDMISEGYLCDIEGYTVKTKIDISDVDDHNGDFSLNQLYKKLSTESRNNMIVSIAKEHFGDRKTMIFCINIQHSKDICKLLNSSGISCAHIDGTMDTIQRQKILSSFREGNISFLTNCQLLTEGFDEPSVDGIILARPTRSRSLFKQMVGRGLRLYAGKKNCKIVDIVDSHSFLAGFNCLYSSVDERFREIERFESFGVLKKHIEDRRLECIEWKIEKVSLFNTKKYDAFNIISSQEKYLIDNDIYFDQNISFDEASFLIWMNELKKEFYGLHKTA